MDCKIKIIPRLLHFKQPAGTSRGTYSTRKVWYLHFTSSEFPGRVGIGECAPLPALSCDDLPDYEDILGAACREVEKQNGRLDVGALRKYPSILFGLETAIRHYHTGDWALWNTAFSRGETGIPINGLIWMGDFNKMLAQIETKMNVGFRCIKLKIGAINFEEELALLRHIRAHFSSNEIELRVDANGAFAPADAMEKLKRLSELDLHSIEQPIRAGQWEEMARLTSESPLPIALDEELIGCNTAAVKGSQNAAGLRLPLRLLPLHAGHKAPRIKFFHLLRQKLTEQHVVSLLHLLIDLGRIFLLPSPVAYNDGHFPRRQRGLDDAAREARSPNQLLFPG